MKNVNLMLSSMRRIMLTVFLSTLGLYAMAQNTMEVSGMVKDEQGLEVIGASVMEEGATNGVITDINGQFKIKVKEGAKLKISYVGYNTIVVKAQPHMTITMEVASNLIDELVVTGYTTQRKADLTGSVSIVSTKDLKTSPDADPMRALQGRVPGMTITTNGSPIGTGTVRIRGVGSINSSQDPLFVIDGVPTTTSLNSLNTNDIESMQVLKDAASASIYGSRAANGVIIITTKQGKKGGKMKVDFSTNLTASFYTSQSLMKLCNSAEYATAMAQAALNDGIDPVTYAANYGLNLNSQTGTPITVWNPATEQYVNYTVNGRYDGFINSSKTMRYSDTDWLDEISRTGFSQNYDLSLSNATDKYSALFSLGYKKNEGILKYTSFENISARMNTSYNINKIVKVGENFTVTWSRQVDSAPMENALKMAPIVPVYEIDGETFGGPVGSMSDRQNPLREMYQNKDNHLDYWRLFGNAYVELKPIEGLVLRSSFGIDYYTSFIQSMNHTFHSDIVNNNIASVTLSNKNDLNWTWSNTATYNFTLADKHNFSVLLGAELSKQNSIDWSGYSEGFGFEDPDYMWPNAATGTARVSGAMVGYRLASFFGKVDYNYDDLVLASFTIRRDGSSRFGKDNRWGTFPAATLGFRASKLIDKNWLDDWKIRLSWGKTGNQAIDNNAQFGIYVVDYGLDRITSTAYDLYLQGSGTFPSGYRATQLPNPNLKWEVKKTFNAYGLLQGNVRNCFWLTVRGFG